MNTMELDGYTVCDAKFGYRHAGSSSPPMP